MKVLGDTRPVAQIVQGARSVCRAAGINLTRQTLAHVVRQLLDITGLRSSLDQALQNRPEVPDADTFTEQVAHHLLHVSKGSKFGTSSSTSFGVVREKMSNGCWSSARRSSS